MTDETLSDVPNVQNPAPGSILAQLRERRIAASADRRHLVDVPGAYSDILVAEYKPLAYEALMAIGERADKTMKNNPRKDLFVQIDTLVAACVALHYKQDDGTTKPLTEKLLDLGESEDAMTFDQPLAVALGMEGAETMNARTVMLSLFPDPLAIFVHYNQFLEWQASGESDPKA